MTVNNDITIKEILAAVVVGCGAVAIASLISHYVRHVELSPGNTALICASATAAYFWRRHIAIAMQIGFENVKNRFQNIIGHTPRVANSGEGPSTQSTPAPSTGTIN
jgi:hypothetical protein